MPGSGSIRNCWQQMAGVGLRQLGPRLIDVGGDVSLRHSVQAQGNYETGKYTGTEPGIVDKRLQTHSRASATQSVLITTRYRAPTSPDSTKAQISPQPMSQDRQCESLQHRLANRSYRPKRMAVDLTPILRSSGRSAMHTWYRKRPSTTD
ncbi:MAG: hypothetical protein Ct9H300mP14_00150 [Gammaproteobacteria bacterium]|nr:MAG: hypothetical protein Ct9H300mP14_00150 [Gammaproteobacteria bacterium]